MKNMLKKEYLLIVRKVLETQLNGGNLITALNA